MKSKWTWAPLVGLLAIVFAATAPAAGATPPATQCAPAANYPAARTPVAFWSEPLGKPMRSVDGGRGSVIDEC